MAEQLALGFGGLLRQLRDEAGLTQEELAEAASLSPRSVSDLERGINRTARKDTAELLASALGLAEPARPVFVAAARGRAPAEEVLAALRGSRRARGPAGRRPLPGAGAVRGAGRPALLRTRRAGRSAGAAAGGAAGRGGDPAGGRGVGVGQVLAAAGGVAAAAGRRRAGAGIGAVAAAGDPAHRQPAAGAGDDLAEMAGADPVSVYRSLSAAPGEAPMLAEQAARTATGRGADLGSGGPPVP